jgi:hypothetical protein
VLLLPIGTSLLCIFGACGHLLVTCLLTHQHLQFRYLFNPSCSLSPRCCALLLLIDTFLLCILNVHQCFLIVFCVLVTCQHLLAKHYWCALAPSCYAFLLFVATLLLCAFVVCQCPITMCFCCSLIPLCCGLLMFMGASLLHVFLFIHMFSPSTFQTPSVLHHLLVMCSSLKEN